jgi:CheY-like chemotaxis protein
VRAPTALVLALAPDLLLASRIEQALAPLGYAVECVADAATLLARARAARPALVLVDLAARGTDPLGAIAALKGDDELATVPVVAFGPHREAERLAAARAAGADRAVSNGRLVADLPGLVGQVGGGAAAGPRGV